MVSEYRGPCEVAVHLKNSHHKTQKHPKPREPNDRQKAPENYQIPRVGKKLKTQSECSVIGIGGNQPEEDQERSNEQEVAPHNFGKRLSLRSSLRTVTIRVGLRGCHSLPPAPQISHLQPHNCDQGTNPQLRASRTNSTLPGVPARARCSLTGGPPRLINPSGGQCLATRMENTRNSPEKLTSISCSVPVLPSDVRVPMRFQKMP